MVPFGVLRTGRHLLLERSEPLNEGFRPLPEVFGPLIWTIPPFARARVRYYSIRVVQNGVYPEGGPDPRGPDMGVLRSRGLDIRGPAILRVLIWGGPDP